MLLFIFILILELFDDDCGVGFNNIFLLLLLLFFGYGE